MIGRGDGFKEKDPAVAAGKDRQGEKLGRASEGEGEGEGEKEGRGALGADAKDR